MSNCPAKLLGNADGLVAFYPFTGNADDESGNGHDGSINGNAALTSDRFMAENRAYTFPDQSSNISLTNTSDLNLEGGFTLNAWVKYKNTYSVIVGKHICGYVNGFIFGIDYDGQMSLWLANSVWSTVKTNYTFIEDQWYMITASYDAGTGIAKVFVNGEISGSGNVIYNNFSSYPISIGEAYQNNCQPANMSGAVDEVKIYSRPLTETEILTEYNSSKAGLVAFYPFNGNANDESGNGNHGTITGALVTPAADRYGQEGKAYKFWFPDYVSVPTNSSFFTDEFTVSYWYKVEAYWGDRGVLSCVGNQGGYQQVFSAGTTFTYLLGYNFPNGSWFWTNYSVPNTPNTWQHVTTTYKKTGNNASASKLYLNGELKSSDTYDNSIAYPGSDIFYIGRNHSDLGLNGELDEVRFYNNALNDQEIKDLYLSDTKPVLKQPENQSSVNTLTPEMVWISPLTDTEFTFQLSADSLFGSILHAVVTNSFSTQLPGGLLLEGQNYYWRVRSTVNGETGPWSEVWEFIFVNTGLERPSQMPSFFTISPNPADASVKISYAGFIAKTGLVPVTLEILNSMGVVSLKKAEQVSMPGNYEFTIETAALNTGIYYCRLKAGDYSQVRKLVIIH